LIWSRNQKQLRNNIARYTKRRQRCPVLASTDPGSNLTEALSLHELFYFLAARMSHCQFQSTVTSHGDAGAINESGDPENMDLTF
jgi:hypothetical protein